MTSNKRSASQIELEEEPQPSKLSTEDLAAIMLEDGWFPIKSMELTQTLKPATPMKIYPSDSQCMKNCKPSFLIKLIINYL